MTFAFDLDHPAILGLLPLAFLPLLRRGSDSLPFSSFVFLPADRAGRVLSALLRGVAVLGIAALIVGLAAPGRSGAKMERSGHGAEVLILLDRSSSMDAVIIPKAVLASGGVLSTGESKMTSARNLLTAFVAKRPNDRFALTLFGTSVMPVAPFTDHNQAVLAGLSATSMGRGLPNTNLGLALRAAIDEFKQRAYSGSRIILLVTDGGAELDAATRRLIQEGLARERIGLYFIYIRSSGNSPDLLDTNTMINPPDEVLLHRFFSTLATPYHLYQAEDSHAMAAALAQIDRQQNLPLMYFERVPRKDDSALLYGIAAAAAAVLLAGGFFQLRAWA